MKVSPLCFFAVVLAASRASFVGAAQEGLVRRASKAAATASSSSQDPFAERELESPVVLAEVALEGNVTVSFLSVPGDAIFMSTAAPKDGGHHDRLMRLLQVGALDRRDPVRLYQRVLGVGDDVAPPAELVATWDAIQAKRAAGAGSSPSDPPPASVKPSHAENPPSPDGDGDRTRSLQSEWWINNYCTDLGLVTNACTCNLYRTGDYESRLRADVILFNVAAAGRVSQGISAYENGAWRTLYFQAVEDSVVSVYAWGSNVYFSAFVRYAYGDLFHASVYAVDVDDYDYHTCTNGW